MRIGLADACPLIRQAFKEVLRRLPDFAIDWEIDNPLLLQQFLRKRPVELLVFEPVVRGNREALRLVKQLHAEFPKAWLLIYTHTSADNFAISAFRAGASGVLSKDCAVPDLLAALQRLASGKRYLSAVQAEELSLRFLSHKADAMPDHLSTRECEVLDGIAAGKRLKEIAVELFLSPKTVYTYKMRIMERFSLASNADLIRFAQERHEERLRHASCAGQTDQAP